MRESTLKKTMRRQVTPYDYELGQLMVMIANIFLWGTKAEVLITVHFIFGK